MPRRHRVPRNWFETVEDRVWLPPDAQGEQEALFIRKALHLRKGQRVLDAPCGAGSDEENADLVRRFARGLRPGVHAFAAAFAAAIRWSGDL